MKWASSNHGEQYWMLVSLGLPYLKRSLGFLPKRAKPNRTGLVTIQSTQSLETHGLLSTRDDL
jgi:hypothetical protein